MAQNRLPQQEEYEHPGSYLRDLRLYFALDVAEVARRTHIRAKYIQAIEDAQLEAMPGKVYARGYVVTYAEFFGLEAEAFATRYMAQFNAAGMVVPREQGYFVPEPKRREIAKQSSRSWFYLLGALAVIAAGSYLLTQDARTAPQSDVMEVPQSLVEQLRNGVMPVARNAECLSGAGGLSCFNAAKPTVLPGYVQVPRMMYVERETPGTVTGEDATPTESETPAAAAEETGGDAPAAKAAEKPAVKQEAPKAVPAAPQDKKAPASEAKKNTKPQAATPAAAADEPKETLPFKRQGEEDASAATAKEAVANAPAASEEPAAAEEPEEKSGGSLLPGWLVRDSDAPQGYQDPNARSEEKWTPRRRR